MRHEMLVDRLKFFKANLGDEVVMDIDTHQYKEDDFAVDFEQFDEINIKGVYWAQDPNLPDQHKKIYEVDRGGPQEIVFVTEEGFCCETQFVDFIFRSGFSFELIPEETGVDNIKLRETDVAQGVYRIIMYAMDNMDKYYGIYIFPYDNEASFYQSVRYKVEIDSDLEEFYNLPADTYLEPIE
ncbi:MAG: hypothetical protein U5K53_08690 [Halanaerobiales bacterium]|nr:hypothetical protein [Halanaerobiales bacterium]